MMRSDLLPAINALEEELATVDRQAAELRSTINMLCKRAGIELRYSEASVATGALTLRQIKPDTFYGKKMQTAAREFLEMRKIADQGPASPKEIYQALVAGGFQFEARDEITALIGLRATLRKNSATFHKLPNGQYGLRTWYQNVRPPKDESESQSDGAPRKRGRPKGSGRKSAVHKPRNGTDAGNAVRNYLFDLLGKGAEMSLDEIKERAAADGLKVKEGKSLARALNATLLSLSKQKIAEKRGANWRLKAAAGVHSEMAH